MKLIKTDITLLNGRKARASLELKIGKPVLLLGKNGIGKSLFFHYLCQNQKDLFSKKVVFLGQDKITSLWDYSVEDVLTILKEANDHFITNDDYLSYKSLCISNIRQTKIKNLSGGESQKLKLFIAFSTPADIYFLDEPLQFLEVEAKRDLKNYLNQIDKALCIIEHEDLILKNQIKRNILLKEDYLEF